MAGNSFLAKSSVIDTPELLALPNYVLLGEDTGDFGSAGSDSFFVHFYL